MNDTLYGFTQGSVKRISNAVRTVEGEYSPLRNSFVGNRRIRKPKKAKDDDPTTPVAQAYYCKVTGKSGVGYNVDVHETPDLGKIGTGFAMPTMLHISETIPNGTWFVASATIVQGMAVS